MDILDRLVQLAQISGSVNVKCQFQGEWLLDHQAQTQGVVHIITQGEGYLMNANQQVEQVTAGDVIFFPKGSAHRLCSQNDFAKNLKNPTAYQAGLFTLKQTGEGEADFKMFCAHFSYEPQAELIQSLPEMLRLHLEPSQRQAILHLLEWEAGSINLGGKQVINALANVLLVLIIRTYLQQNEQVLGILNGWQNKQLQQLLNALLQNPEQNWSLEEMAAFAHLSRAKLIRLFKQHLATSPHAFLHKIRLQKSAMLLKQSSDSILNIALACGFQSETHFGKAFKKQYGSTPSQYRKN